MTPVDPLLISALSGTAFLLSLVATLAGLALLIRKQSGLRLEYARLIGFSLLAAAVDFAFAAFAPTAPLRLFSRVGEFALISVLAWFLWAGGRP